MVSEILKVEDKLVETERGLNRRVEEAQKEIQKAQKELQSEMRKE
jgi:F0F1-type ATP synthase membrane subunit b/b'